MDPKLVSSWPHVAPCWAKLNPSGAQVGPKLAYVGPSWSKLVQIGFKLAPRWSISPMLAHVGPKLAPCWPISQGVAKACQGVHEGSASKALVFQDVHQGSASRVPTFACLLGRFHPLALDLKGCFFLVLLSACPVMAALSKRCIQKFLSSSSCRQLFLEVSSFFVHCTKAL